MISSISAVLLISENAEELADFYRNCLDIPLIEERHDDTPLHYGCELGPVHFAIHPAEGWPGERREYSRSPIIALATSDVQKVAERLRAHGIEATGPYDHGFAHTVSFRDPDGNSIEVLEFKRVDT